MPEPGANQRECRRKNTVPYYTTRTASLKPLTGHPAVEKNENAHDSSPEGARYEIRVKGHLGREWADWFEGLEFKLLEDRRMLLTARIVDREALIGVLTRLNRLNLALRNCLVQIVRDNVQCRQEGVGDM
jgi:hypothetical protein